MLKIQKNISFSYIFIKIYCTTYKKIFDIGFAFIFLDTF